jgi:exodeoxyribonuclease-3
MRIATFNINGVKTRLPNLLAWLEQAQPDVVCLQELKATDSQFPAAEIEAAGYAAVWAGEHRWNGVAILSRIGEPVVTRRRLPGDEDDRQARYIEAAVNGVLIGCLYLPNGNPRPGPKFDYKLAWADRLIAHAASLYSTAAPVVLAGDYNVVPTDADIYNTRSWKTDALLQPESRAAFQSLLDQGWTDALRERFPHAAPTPATAASAASAATARSAPTARPQPRSVCTARTTSRPAAATSASPARCSAAWCRVATTRWSPS